MKLNSRNGEFQMTTDSSNNSFIQDGELYIMPTFTSDTLGSESKVTDGGSYTLDGCTTQGNKVSFYLNVIVRALSSICM